MEPFSSDLTSKSSDIIVASFCCLYDSMF